MLVKFYHTASGILSGDDLKRGIPSYVFLICVREYSDRASLSVEVFEC